MNLFKEYLRESEENPYDF